MTRIMLAACYGTLLAASSANYMARAGGDPPPTPADPLQSAISRLERELQSEMRLRARGLNTDWDVDFYRADLAEARHDAAQLRGDSEEMGRQLRLLVGVSERNWERMAAGVEHGTTSAIEAEDGRRQLAVARYRLAEFEGRRSEAQDQLKLIIAAIDQKVERLSRAHARQAVGLRQLNYARYVAGSARYLRARADGSAEVVRAEVGRSVALWEVELKQVNQVYGTGAASHFEHYQARHFLATTRLRQATLEQDRAAAADQIRARIQVDDEFLARLDPTDRFLRRVRTWYEWERDYDRYCLERLQRNGVFPPDTAAAELDW